MLEYFTEGIVLKRYARGDFDGSIILYTKDLGKITTFAKSIRKITSKTSGHMLPGNIVQTRIIEKNNIQAVDVLGRKPKCDPKELLEFLKFLDAVIPAGVQDIALWHAVRATIEKSNFSPQTYRYLLEILGFGGEDSKCQICNIGEIAYFSVPDIIPICRLCRSKVSRPTEGLIKLVE